MSARLPGTCTATPDCDHENPCPVHPFKPRRPVDTRPNSYRRGYGGKAWFRARAIVLRRDPLCTWPVDDPDEPGGCDAPSTRADHYPRTRRQLVDDPTVTDPDAPELMRGLCERHHNRHTARSRSAGDTPRG